MGQGQGEDQGQRQGQESPGEVAITEGRASVKEFTDYTSLDEATGILRKHARVAPRAETVPLGLAYGRVLFGDVLSRHDIPARDSSHMDGFAIRSADVSGASTVTPVKLRRVEGCALGEVPRRALRRGEAHSILTGGLVPTGADTVVQAEKVTVSDGAVVFRSPVERGEYIYPRGRDVKKAETVLRAGRVIRGTDLVLLGSLHMDRVPVYAKPRVAILPTGSELSEKIRGTEPGKVAETHTLLLSRLIEGAGGTPVHMPIVRDDAAEIRRSVGAGLRVADIVLTLAGTSVSETDLTEQAINEAGKPGVLVHGMKVTRGRVMGFGVADGNAVVILPGPIQGAVNAFTLLAYPLIRAYLGRGFESPPSIPARLTNDWEAPRRFPTFTKVVFVKTETDGDAVTVESSMGETENVMFLTRNDGYLIVGERTQALKKGDRVRVHLPPGLSPP